MSSADIREIATDLYPGDALIRQIADVRRGLEGRTARRVEEQLQQAVIEWYLALVDLADAGDSAADVVMREPEEAQPGDGEYLYRAQLRAITVLVTGDRVLDGVAWAELLRRGEWPKPMADDFVPSPWALLARCMPADDPLHPDFAYLDLTWCEARDVLIAHPDPRVYALPGYGGDGDVRLQLAAIDEPRERRALEILQEVQRDLPWPGRVADTLLEVVPAGVERAVIRDRYEEILDHTLALPRLLTRQQRVQVNTAQQLAGFRSPPIHDMAARVLSLLRHHLALLGR